MRILVIRNFKYDNGFKIIAYRLGEIEVGCEVGNFAISKGFAKRVYDFDNKIPRFNKAAKRAPLNKNA